MDTPRQTPTNPTNGRRVRAYIDFSFKWRWLILIGTLGIGFLAASGGRFNIRAHFTRPTQPPYTNTYYANPWHNSPTLQHVLVPQYENNTYSPTSTPNDTH